jgi:hypothetical protein
MHIIRVPLSHQPALRINCTFSETRCQTFELARYLYPGQPSFSSTGRLAVTLTVDRGAYDAGHIGTIGFDGEGLRLVGPLRLATRSRRDGMPDWSPGADSIVFQREKFTGRAYNGDVFVAPAGGERHRRPRRLTETRDAFFPSGRRTGAGSPTCEADSVPAGRCGRCVPATAERSGSWEPVWRSIGSAGSRGLGANRRTRSPD